MSNKMKLIMENWNKFLNEEQYVDKDGDNWWDGKDVDFLSADKGPFIFFDKNQTYNKEGQTHGMFSHFLKHIKDIGLESDLKSINDMLVNSLRDGLTAGTEIYFHDGQNATELTDELLSKFAGKNLDKITRITLDRINDDIISGRQVTDLETKIFNKAKEYSKKYDDLVNDVIEDPEAKATSQEDPKKSAFVKDGKLVITYDNKIASAFGDKRCAANPTACADKAVSPKK